MPTLSKWPRSLLFIWLVVSVLVLLSGNVWANPNRGNLDVAPAVVTAGDPYTILGDNFDPGELVRLSAATPGCCSAHNVVAEADGTFAVPFTAGVTGDYVFTALVTRGNSGKLGEEDVLEFEVLP